MESGEAKEESRGCRQLLLHGARMISRAGNHGNVAATISLMSLDEFTEYRGQSLEVRR
jgi:hypothetical protein